MGPNSDNSVHLAGFCCRLLRLVLPHWLYAGQSDRSADPLGHSLLAAIPAFIAAGFVLSINFTLQEVEHRSLASTILVGYTSSILVFSAWIHFAICGALRFVMIYSPEDLNDVPDQKIEICVW